MSRMGCCKPRAGYSGASCLPPSGPHVSDNVAWDFIRVFSHRGAFGQLPFTDSPSHLPPRYELFVQPDLPSPVLVRVTLWWYTWYTVKFRFAGFRLLFSPVKLFKTPNFVSKQIGHLLWLHNYPMSVSSS